MSAPSTPTSLEKRDIEQPSEKVEIIGEHLHIEHVKSAQLPYDATKVVDVKNAAFTAAVRAGKLDPWSRSSFILYTCCFISFLTSCSNGYDGSLMTGINVMPFYQNRFNAGEAGATTGLIFSLYTVGSMVGSWFAGPVADNLGRRRGMFVGAVLVCISSAIISSSMAKPQFEAGRFCLGFAVQIMGTSSASYCVEICPPQWRGRMTGFYNCGWFGGSIPAAGIVLGCSSINNDLSWRLPLVFQAVPCVVVICACLFMPESPRWLFANGRDDEARAFLIRYHGNSDAANPLVELQWHEFKESIMTNGTDKRWWDYSDLFNTSSARWRSLMVILMGIFGQFSGNGLGYFNTEIYKDVGYDTYMQLMLNLAGSFLSAFGASLGVVLCDYMPRRVALVNGTFICALLLAGNGATSIKWAQTNPDDESLNIGKASVAFYFLFSIVYSFSYTPLQTAYPVESLATNSRAKGMAMYGFVVNAIGFINLYAGPIAIQNMGAQYYVLVFVGWDIVESILWYFLAVETQGRTLEELEEIFSARNPVAASKVKKRVALKSEGAVAVLDG